MPARCHEHGEQLFTRTADVAPTWACPVGAGWCPAKVRLVALIEMGRAGGEPPVAADVPAQPEPGPTS